MKIQENDVFVNPEPIGRDRFRRVIGILQGHVFYSTGDDRVRQCQLRQMRRWIADYSAEKANK